jgi:hypothetical protein
MTVSAIAAIVTLLLIAGFLLSALDRRPPARAAGRAPRATQHPAPRGDRRRGRAPGSGDR